VLSTPALQHVLDAMPPLWAAMTRSAGGHVTGARGVYACVTPSMPDRSLPNSVLYEDPDALVPQLHGLAKHYARHGIRAWTVWVHPGHEVLAGILAGRGHVLDADPAGMVMRDLALLGDLPAPPHGFAVEHPGTAADLGTLNDEAYNLPADRAVAPLVSAMEDLLAIHLVRDPDGKAVAGAAVHDHAGDAELVWVATSRSRQRRGLGGLVTHHALMAARTLQATKLGEPVYRRLGYEAVGNLQMWEWRAPVLS
jgi:GNAT superfamily N-acetyltransferase